MKTIERNEIKHFEIQCEKRSFCKCLLINYCKHANITPQQKELFAKAKELCQRVTKWLYGERKFNSLLIQGGVGTGKTTLFKALIDTKVILDEQEFKHNLTNFTRAVRLNDENLLPEGLIDFYAERKGLVIDDMGSEEPVVKSWGREYRPMERILKRRSDDKLPTIVTTNLSLEQVRVQYNSDRLADVLAQYDILTLNNPQSFRRL